jgi:SulP family sulfate permease
LDEALEWCEDYVLDAYGADRLEDDFDAWIADRWSGPGAVADLLAYFEPTSFAEGEILIRQGDPPETLYLIVTGAVTAYVQHPDGPPVRFETMGGGSVVGELGFFAGTTRTASVIADAATISYRLTKGAHARMAEDDPSIAAGFHGLVVRILADRTKHLMRVVEALQR